MKVSITYNFLTDFDTIHNQFSPDYSFNMCFSLHCPYTDGQSFSQYKPSQIVHFRKVGTMQIFLANCTHLLTRTQKKKFEDVFLVK